MDVESLKGKVILDIIQKDDEELFFLLNDGSVFKMYHEQDCCERVYLYDIVGDFQDLIGSELLMAESSTKEPSQKEQKELCLEAGKWTFYKFATIKGYVDLRWLGNSNGYYSTSVYTQLLTLNDIKDNQELRKMIITYNHHKLNEKLEDKKHKLKQKI